MAYNNIYAPKT